MTQPRQANLPADVNDALVRLAQQLASPWAYPSGPVLECYFPAADVPRQVAHGLRAVPDGYLVLLQTGAVYAVDPAQWTEDVALLTAPVANTYARLWFYRLRQTPERV